jgi:hypothetical protein
VKARESVYAVFWAILFTPDSQENQCNCRLTANQRRIRAYLKGRGSSHRAAKSSQHARAQKVTENYQFVFSKVSPHTGSNNKHLKVSPNIAQTPPSPTPQAVGGRRLSWSTKVFQLTPRLHQTHLLWEPSSRKNGNGCLFSGEASSLDAFSSYPQQRGCPATALSDNRLTRGYSVPFLSY